jgi:catechol 2,3-dioxygenase-like lactoylglutathione lyase family enzyme
MAEENSLRSYAFVLAVRDLAASAAYFQDVLGFRLEWQDADDWRLLSRGGVRMMLGHCPNERLASEIGDHSYIAYLDIDDVDALHSEIAARGAIIRQAPADKPYGMREMLIATPDGHRIIVGQPL